MAADRKKGEIDPSLKTPTPHVERKGRPPDPKRRCPVEDRRCPRHGITEFALYSAGDGRKARWKCKRCVGEAVTRRLQKVKRTLVEEAGGCCCVCEHDRYVIDLHFHHVDPQKKSFSMTVAMGKSLASLREEAKKCVLVCANCHGEIEASLIECPPLGAIYATWGARRRRPAAT
jgi:cytochrome c553